MKQLYNVTVTHNLVIVADSLKEAERVALRARRDDYPSAEATPFTHLPPDWSYLSIPYGEEDSEDPNRTIEGWIAKGAAPKYKASLRAALD